MWERIKHIFIKETIQIRTDKRMMSTIFLAPVLQLLLLGYAVNMDVDRIPTAVLDFSRTQESRQVISLFKNSGRFQINYFPESQDELDQLLDKGEVWVGMEIKSDFVQQLKKGESVPIQIIIDGTNSNTAGIVSGYISYLLQSYNLKIIQDRILRRPAADSPAALVSTSRIPQLENEIRAWYNPELKSRDYNIPAVLAQLLILTTMMLTSMAIVKEKEIGTIEQLMVTPIRTSELILGKVAPFALIGFIDVCIITLVAVLWFRIPFRGNFFFLLLSVMVYLLTTLGIGLFISTLARTQQQAMMMTFFVLMPANILSGFMFPIANMPRLIQYLTYLNPLRYFIVIVRGIFLKGNGISILWSQILPLGTIGVVVLVLSILRFRKKIG
ncbi:MAG TPA: ABC transporter permease [Terriglobales bacterium]|nr:ABC transporter permease [Terriglobales bacterium]